MIKLAVNTTCLLSPLTGIGQYTYHLCKQLLKQPDIDPFFFDGNQWQKRFREQPVQGIETYKEIIKRFVPRAYKAKEWMQKRAFAKVPVKGGFDIYHEPNYLPLSYKHRLVLTVHDVSFLRYPEAHPIARLRALERFPEAVEKADAIITDSHFTARELMDCMPVHASKIFPIHLGVTSQYYPRPAEALEPCLQRYELPSHGYILVVGTLEPRKNLKLVLDAYRAMPAKNQNQYPLVIIGMKGWGDDGLDQNITSLINKGCVIMLGYVPSEDMPLLYAAAKLFVYPSIYEGFGLPPLEAMASGVPVISSNRASLPEVVGNAGIQVDADDADMLRDSMHEILSDEDKQGKMIQNGLLQAKNFTWERCAAETIDVYKKVLGH